MHLACLVLCFSSVKRFATPITGLLYLFLDPYTFFCLPCHPLSSSALLFQVGGAAVLGVGIWTLLEKSDYSSLLASSTFAVSTYILILAGSLVVVTGFLGCCAVIREQRSCLSTYFFFLLLIFVIELVAGVLAYVYYQRVSVHYLINLKLM